MKHISDAEVEKQICEFTEFHNNTFILSKWVWLFVREKNIVII